MAAKAAKVAKKRELKGIGYELFIGALSILSITNLILMLVIGDDSSLETVLMIMNAIMFPIFLGDFLYRFFTSTNRSQYSSAASAGPICCRVCPSSK